MGSTAKCLTPEYVVKKLKKLAATKAAEMPSPYRLAPPRPIHYLRVAGPYKLRAGIFAGSNYTFNPSTMEARSYGWWSMLTVRNGLIVRNHHNYSRATAKHQSRLSDILRDLGIKADVTISVRANIAYSLTEAKEELLRNYGTVAIQLKYGQKKSQKTLVRCLKYAESSLKDLTRLGVKYTKAEVFKAIEDAETARTQRLSWNREKKVRDQGFKTVVTSAPVEVQAPIFTIIEGGLV